MTDYRLPLANRIVAGLPGWGKLGLLILSNDLGRIA
jgi:hypothetical protein